jgi:glycosyltransferase involved in cell wall biosynthesis
MRILISYSKNHFDPRNSDSTFSSSGTALLAKCFFDTLNALPSVDRLDYIDFSEYKSLPRGEAFDFVFGLSPNFRELNSRVNARNRVLFSVNRNNKYRYASIAQSAAYGPAHFRRLSSEDGIFADPKDFESATKVLQLGGWSNFLANRKAGVGDYDQYLVAFSRELRLRDRSQSSRKNQILFFAGSVSERKGLFALEAICNLLTKQHSVITVNIVGRPVSREVAEHLFDLIQRFPKNLLWTSEFIHEESPAWQRIFDEARFAICPSLEEGQQDATMQAISRGVPVLMSGECGFESIFEEAFVFDDNPESWANAAEKMLRLDHQALELWAKKQQTLESLRLPKTEQVANVLKRMVISDGRDLWPSIFNSADQSLRDFSYPNVAQEVKEADMIFTNRAEIVPKVRVNFCGDSQVSTEKDNFLRAVLMLERYPHCGAIETEARGQNRYLALTSGWAREQSQESELTVISSGIGRWVSFSSSWPLLRIRFRLGILKSRRLIAGVFRLAVSAAWPWK